MKVVIYSRVSTNSQDFKRQTEELMEFSKKNNYEVVDVFEEKISGGKTNEERPQLMEMINFVKTNKIDKVLCWELSRIGRNTIEVLKTIQLLNENCISLYIKNHNIETLNDKCEINPMSQFLIQILTSVSEMEKTQIRQRIKSGYESFRKNGGVNFLTIKEDTFAFLDFNVKFKNLTIEDLIQYNLQLTENAVKQIGL